MPQKTFEYGEYEVPENEDASCRYTVKAISKRVVFSKPSVKRKLEAAKHLRAPLVRQENGNPVRYYCSVHLEYIYALEAQFLR